MSDPITEAVEPHILNVAAVGATLGDGAADLLLECSCGWNRWLLEQNAGRLDVINGHALTHRREAWEHEHPDA